MDENAASSAEKNTIIELDSSETSSNEEFKLMLSDDDEPGSFGEMSVPQSLTETGAKDGLTNEQHTEDVKSDGPPLADEDAERNVCPVAPDAPITMTDDINKDTPDDKDIVLDSSENITKIGHKQADIQININLDSVSAGISINSEAGLLSDDIEGDKSETEIEKQHDMTLIEENKVPSKNGVEKTDIETVNDSSLDIAVGASEEQTDELILANSNPHNSSIAISEITNNSEKIPISNTDDLEVKMSEIESEVHEKLINKEINVKSVIDSTEMDISSKSTTEKDFAPSNISADISKEHRCDHSVANTIVDSTSMEICNPTTPMETGATSNDDDMNEAGLNVKHIEKKEDDDSRVSDNFSDIISGTTNIEHVGAVSNRNYHVELEAVTDSPSNQINDETITTEKEPVSKTDDMNVSETLTDDEMNMKTMVDSSEMEISATTTKEKHIEASNVKVVVSKEHIEDQSFANTIVDSSVMDISDTTATEKAVTSNANDVEEPDTKEVNSIDETIVDNLTEKQSADHVEVEAVINSACTKTSAEVNSVLAEKSPDVTENLEGQINDVVAGPSDCLEDQEVDQLNLLAVTGDRSIDDVEDISETDEDGSDEHEDIGNEEQVAESSEVELSNMDTSDTEISGLVIKDVIGERDSTEDVTQDTLNKESELDQEDIHLEDEAFVEDVYDPTTPSSPKIQDELTIDEEMPTTSPPTVEENEPCAQVDEVQSAVTTKSAKTAESQAAEEMSIEIEKAIAPILAEITSPEKVQEKPIDSSPVIRMEIETTPEKTVNEKPTSDVAMPSPKAAATKDNNQSSPKKLASLKISEPSKPLDIVDLEESSSDCEVSKVSTEDESAVSKRTRSAKNPKFSLEVFSLDSDDEPEKTAALRNPSKCVNYKCPGVSDEYLPASGTVLTFCGVKRSKKSIQYVCDMCFEKIALQIENLIDGVQGMKPLLDIHLEREIKDIVEISDSDSEDGSTDVTNVKEKEVLSDHNKRLFDAELENVINDTWDRYDLENRLDTCVSDIKARLERIEKESEEINRLYDTCQLTMDNNRNSLYQSFRLPTREDKILQIVDTPWIKHCREFDAKFEQRRESAAQIQKTLSNSLKRTLFNASSGEKSDSSQLDDSITVVNSTAEAPPPWLPPIGELSLPKVHTYDHVFALKGSTFGAWTKARVTQILPKAPNAPLPTSKFTVLTVRFLKQADQIKTLTGRQIAYVHPSPTRYPIGTRVAALFKDPLNKKNDGKDTYYAGIIAEMPTPVNEYRYLVFFDDGYASYVRHDCVMAVCEVSDNVWDDVHPDSRAFVKNYLMKYPERPMVRLQAGQSLKVEWNSKWCFCKVVQVDASLVLVKFEEDSRQEWIYRGSTRLAPLFLELQAAGRKNRHRTTKFNPNYKMNMPYVEYTRTDEQGMVKEGPAPVEETANTAQERVSVEGQPQGRVQSKAVAKKSTTTVAVPTQFSQQPSPPQALPARPIDNVMSRVVYYSPKTTVKPLKMVAHKCNASCRRSDVIPLKDLKNYNPLARPLLAAWERQTARFKGKKRVVIYRAPCGRRLRSMEELHMYLRLTKSDYTVDLFDFSPQTHCLAEFVLNKFYVNKKDLSQGKENVQVPCVNYYDTSLPEFCAYNTERTPTAGVTLNLDPEFLCGCDCTDDCADKTKCACWRMTLEGARTIGMVGNVGYKYRRLLEPVPSGIYECNSRCKCSHTCLNRVAQFPLQLKLQVFKTYNRGWGIRALNDVPKGGFLCIYAGNLLTDDTANTDGKREGDEYLAELDYIEVVERMKEGYESDVHDDLNEDGKKPGHVEKEDSYSSEAEQEEDRKLEKAIERRNSMIDKDFRPEAVLPELLSRATIDVRSRLRERKKPSADEKENSKKEESGASADPTDHFITISDDEEVREPSSLAALANPDSDDYTPKYRSVRSFFGENEDCYIMDAKVQGNIGRYLNHSCQPNVFVQNVFVDTHDPRFPWVAFFALSLIRAGTELTWNYNYDVGSVPGKVMYCKCGAANCRGRLL